MAEGAADTMTSEKGVRPKSSKAWEHFNLNAAKKVVTCKLCKTCMAQKHNNDERAHETETRGVHRGWRNIRTVS